MANFFLTWLLWLFQHVSLHYEVQWLSFKMTDVSTLSASPISGPVRLIII